MPAAIPSWPCLPPISTPMNTSTRVRKPEEFDAFWADVLREAAAIPLDTVCPTAADE
jgi:hypothetical protein